MRRIWLRAQHSGSEKVRNTRNCTHATRLTFRFLHVSLGMRLELLMLCIPTLSPAVDAVGALSCSLSAAQLARALSRSCWCRSRLLYRSWHSRSSRSCLVSAAISLLLNTSGPTPQVASSAACTCMSSQKWGPTKHCCILHGIGSTTTTDQRECGFWIVGLFVFPLCASK